MHKLSEASNASEPSEASEMPAAARRPRPRRPFTAARATAAVAMVGLTVCGLMAADLYVSAGGRAPAAAANAYGLEEGTPALRSIGALAWGPENVLFLGDTAGGAVHALETPALPADASVAPLKVPDVDKKIAALLGTTPDQIVIRDMKTHRASQQIFLSVMNGRGAQATPALVRISHDGTLARVPLTNVRFATLPLSNAPAADAKTPWGDSSRALSITTLGFIDNQVYIAGLSNEEFASDLRIAPFPFTGAAKTTSVEIFHTSHNRYETHAPIETFVPFHVKGVPALLAGYGCAPLASFRISELTNGTKKVRGETLAELGGGNRPLDMVSITRNGEDVVLIANSARTLMRVGSRDLDKAQPLTQGVGDAYVSAGVPYLSIAVVGILQLDDFNADHVIMLQRDIETGALNLTTFQKKWL
jgi:hypothetical protein